MSRMIWPRSRSARYRPVNEREDSNEEREKRNEGEEDLVRDRAGQEGTVVVGEAHDDRAGARNVAG